MYLSLASPAFLGLAILAAVLLATLGGWLRHAAFLLVNLAYLNVFLLGPTRAVPVILFCLLGFVFVRLIVWRPTWGFPAALATYVLLFAYLRDYGFLRPILPDPLLTHGLFAVVGLSFLFFKVVHVMIEARSGTLGQLSLPTYLNYCLNFSVFMMGPIQRYQDFDAQWSGREEAAPRTFETHLDAMLRILVGLGKAYVLGALLMPYALSNSPDLMVIPVPELIGRIIAFYFFLYLNFSGYCDVVIGIGILLGIRPPENFDKPFLARNIADFWQRFHRSLTQWLTDYVFSPAYKWSLHTSFLGARPLLAMTGALIVTMLISGLWHGTTLAFLFFGLAHGLFFTVFRTWEAVAIRLMGRKRLRALREMPVAHAAGVLLTFAAVALSLVFFQLDASTAFNVFGRLVGL